MGILGYVNQHDQVSLPGTPQAVYSTFKLVGGYTGNGIKITRLSDSTTLDVGFSGTVLNKAAIDAFTSGGTIDCTVNKIYDQSGNGFHLDVEASRDEANLFYDPRHSNYILRFLPRTVSNAAVGDVADVGEASYANTSLAVALNSFSCYQIERGNKRFPGRSRMIWEFGNISGNDIMYYEFNNNYNRHCFVGSDQAETGTYISNSTEFAVKSFRTDGATNVLTGEDNFYNTTMVALGSFTATGFRIGQWSNSLGDYNMESDWCGTIIYGSGLNGTDHTTINDQLHRLLGTSFNHNELVVAIGDSLTGGYGLQKDENWLIQFERSYNNPSIRWVNSGIASDTITGINGDRANRASNYLTTPAFATTPTKKIAIVWAGTNDIALNGDTGATAYANFTTLCNNLRSDGFTKIIGMDIIPRYGLLPTPLAEVANFNAALNADHSMLDGYVQLSTLSWAMGVTHLSDNVHINPAGTTLVITALKPVLDTFI